jgi:hypothetical protein
VALPGKAAILVIAVARGNRLPALRWTLRSNAAAG